ncbi:MAG: response regulator [Proteobacteria bacterium]|nr:MAG: response regulator [Pseudomonadota bacterium]
MTGRRDAVLVVDDDPDFAEALVRALGRRGFEADNAQDIDMALDSARRRPPGGVVLDLRLCDESGLALIAPLLDIDGDMTIVVLTGYGSISTAVEAIKAGATDYLTKPVDVERLVRILRGDAPRADVAEHPDPISLRRLEWEHIQRVLSEHHGNISATARSLGMHRRTLQRKLQKRPVRQ